MRSTRAIIIASFACLTFAAPKEKVAPDLKKLRSGQLVDVIVRYSPSLSGAGEARLKSKGIEKKADLNLVRSKVYRMKAGDAAQLENDTDVESVQPDRPVKVTEFSGGPDYGWMTAINAVSPVAKLPFDGTGVGVAILDSGVDDHPDLKGGVGSRIVYRESFVPGDPSPGDMYGHGNHVAGILAGNGALSSGRSATYVIRGLASNANVISLRVLDLNGTATDSVVIAAIARAIELKSRYNIRVMNLSLGRPVMSSYLDDPLCQAVQQAWEAGIVVVVAAGNYGRTNEAGNYGYGTIASPGNSPYVITVGAMNTNKTPYRADDIVASYSSKGPTVIDHVAKPDLVAPGNRVLSLGDQGSTLDQAAPENRVPSYVYSGTASQGTGAYFQLSGTSMAAPTVSAAAALLIQQNPMLTPDQVKARLMKTASKFPAMTTYSFDPLTGYSWTSQYDIFTIGAGYLDVRAALASLDSARGLALSPTVRYEEATGNVLLIADTRSVWGTSGDWATTNVWGNRSVWGTGSVWGTTTVWGTRSVWGTETSAGFDAIWDLRSVWGTNSVWGVRSVWGTNDVSALGTSLNGDQ